MKKDEIDDKYLFEIIPKNSILKNLSDNVLYKDIEAV